MPITDPEWESIVQLIRKVAGQHSGKRQDYFVTGAVIKVDEPNKCVYMAEFGDQPIPLVAFDYTINYYDTDATGTIQKKTAISKVKMPAVGDTIVVARELGTRRLPRALGILKGQNWVVAEEE